MSTAAIDGLKRGGSVLAPTTAGLLCDADLGQGWVTLIMASCSLVADPAEYLALKIPFNTESYRVSAGLMRSLRWFGFGRTYDILFAVVPFHHSICSDIDQMEPSASSPARHPLEQAIDPVSSIS